VTFVALNSNPCKDSYEGDGSEQAGPTGFKGSIVRKVAVDRSASSLQKSLATIKDTLERWGPGN
jgi:hypothetical protein